MGMQEISEKRNIIVIVRGIGEKYILKLAEALLNGGIDMMEVTFNQAEPNSWDETCRAIRSVKNTFAGRMSIGAGTVLSVEQLHIAHDAGAEFFVSPNVDADVIREGKRLGMEAFPGALTPTEAVLAHKAGADAVKLFPAGDLGPSYLKSVRAPLSHIKFLAVGGINEKNAADFIHAGAVGIGVGGSLVNKAWIEEGEFEKITALAKEYRKAVDEA